MKVLLCIALLLAVSSAAVLPKWTPKWKVVNSFNNSWTPNNVYAQANPLPGQSSRAVVCGTAQADTASTSYDFVLANGDQIYNQGTGSAYSDNLFQNSKYCFSHPYTLPEDATAPYTLTLTLKNPNEGLVSVEFTFYF